MVDLNATRIVIRTASANDAQLLTELGARTFHDTFAADNAESDMAAYLATSFSAEVQEQELADPSSTFLIASVGDVAAGYARVSVGGAPTCVSAVRPMEIVRLYADAPWIGRGVGAALMEACLREATAAECDVAWLAVWERNPRAIAFYTKWGFSAVGSQVFVVGADVQHDVLMVRRTDRVFA